jgi:hypothetical protein
LLLLSGEGAAKRPVDSNAGKTVPQAKLAIEERDTLLVEGWMHLYGV